MSFQVKSIRTAVEDHPIRTRRIVASFAGRHSTSRFLTIMVEEVGGTRGYGEASTTLIWSGESAETAEWLIATVLGPLVTGPTFDHPRDALELMDSAVVGCPFTKAGIDTALWDLWARTREVSAVQLFSNRHPVLAIPTRASIGAYPVAQTVQLAREFWNSGVRILKFKVGVPGLDDVARLKAVREELGAAPVFTIDANGAYETVDLAVAAIESLIPFQLAVVEQPTPRHRISLLAEVKRRLSVPVLADEAIFHPDHLREALDLDAFDIVSLYPGKNGGFTRSLEMADVVQRAGKVCAIGSNLETDLGQSAMAALAAGHSAFPVQEIPGDFASSLYYERSSVTRPLVFEEGLLQLPRGREGFGVTPLIYASDSRRTGKIPH